MSPKSLFQRIKKVKIKTAMLYIALFLLVLLPIIVAINSYRTSNTVTDLNEFDSVNVTIYDDSDNTIATESGIPKYMSDTSIVNIFHSILSNKIPTTTNIPDSILKDTRPLKAVIASGAKTETIVCYFSVTEHDSYYIDNSTQWYRITREDAARFCATQYSEAIYSSSVVPSLITADGDKIIPRSADWSYRTQSGNFVSASGNKTTSNAQSYTITGSLALSFDKAPDLSRVKIYKNSVLFFEGTLDTLSSLNIDIEDKLSVQLDATWSKSRESNFYGTASYKFSVSFRNHSVFTVSDDSISTGEYIVLSCTNIDDPSKLVITSEHQSISPVFFHKNGTLRCLIPFPIDYGYDKFDFSVRYGASFSNFSISVSHLQDSKPPIVLTPSNIDESKLPDSINDSISEIISNSPNAASSSIYILEKFLSPKYMGFSESYDFYDDLVINAKYPQTLKSYGTEFLSTVPYSEVSALNAGKILFAGRYDILGNVVIIDHGMGLVTWYFGLSDIRVTTDGFVRKGETIGRSGTCVLSSENGFILMTSINGVMIDPKSIIDKKLY